MFTRFHLLLVWMMVALAITSPAAPPANFTGSWDGPDSESYTFGFDLTQTDNQITGFHNAVAQHGKRVDAVLPGDPPSITGTVTGNVAQIHFRSGYGEDAGGNAVITLQGDGRLHWKVTDSTGQHYFPDDMILHREKKAPAKTKPKH